MKISTKGRYAVNIMLDMALNDTGDYIKLKSIAQRQQLSGKYLEHIIAILNRAGYVKSSRGSQGGYKLTKPLGQYTLGMILRLTEGVLAPAICLEYQEDQCPKRANCTSYEAWRRLDDAINETIDKITLADILEWNQKKS